MKILIIMLIGGLIVLVLSSFSTKLSLTEHQKVLGQWKIADIKLQKVFSHKPTEGVGFFKIGTLFNFLTN